MLSHRHRKCGILCLCEMNVFYKSQVIRSGKGGQVNDKKKIAIVPYVTNGRNSQVGHDGHFNIF